MDEEILDDWFWFFWSNKINLKKKTSHVQKEDTRGEKIFPKKPKMQDKNDSTSISEPTTEAK